MSIKMSKKQIQNERVESNLRVLKLLSNNDPSINEEQKREVLNGYTGWGGLREAIFTRYAMPVPFLGPLPPSSQAAQSSSTTVQSQTLVI